MKTPVLPCAILLPLLPLLSPFLPPTYASPTIDLDRWERNRLQAVAKPLADLDVGEPRTVRLVYFRPQDRPFRAEVVDSMKAAILRIRTWFAAEMQRHGHGDLTFRFETDDQGEPLVHRVDGEEADAHYLDHSTLGEIWRAMGGQPPVLFVVLDLSANTVPYWGGGAGAVTWRSMVDGVTVAATVVVPSRFSWRTVAHELGHAFDLEHDFRDSEYIMSYGWGDRARLSACAAEYLIIHPFFNPGIAVARPASPTSVDLISLPGYPAGSTSTPIRLKIRNSPGLHQVVLFATTQLPHFATGGPEVKACRSFSGEPAAVVEFDYDGVIPSMDLSSLANPIVHRMQFRAVDISGRTTRLYFGLYQTSELHVATLEQPGVTSLAFSPDGATLASAAGDSLIRVWDRETRDIMAGLGPAPRVWAVAISPDGETVATSHNGEVKLWELATGTETATLEGRPGDTRYRSVAFSPPDGKTLAVGFGDRSVRLWDLATESTIRDLEHDTKVTSIAFSPDGSRLAVAGSDGTVNLWDPVTGTNVTLEAHDGWVGAVAFSPDGATLASQAGWDGLVRLWDIETRRSFRAIENTRGGAAVAFSPDGATLACASGDLVKLWDVGTGVRIDSLAHRGPVQVVAFSPDGETLASAIWRGIELWDGSEWLKPRPHELVEISGDGQEGAPGAALENPLVVEVRDQYGNGIAGAPVTFVVTEGDGRLDGRFTVESKETDADGRAVVRLILGNPGPVAVEATLLEASPVTFNAVTVGIPLHRVGDGDPRKWRLPARATVRLGKGTMGNPDAFSDPVSFSPDGQHLALATRIGIWLYDVATSRERDLFPGPWVTAVAFAPDGTLAAGLRDGGAVALWGGREERTVLYRHYEAVRSVAFSPDGTLLGSASENKLKLWDVASGVELWEARAARPRADGEFRSVAFSSDGTILAATGLEMGEYQGRAAIRLWDVESAAEITTLDVTALDDGTEILVVALSPDGTTLATGSWNTVKLWDVAQGRVIATLPGNSGETSALAFSSDGAILAAGSWRDQAVGLWDVATGKSLATLEHSTPAHPVAFSPDGGTLASMSPDGIWVWDIPTESGTRIQGHDSSVESVAFSPGGATLAVASGTATKLWDIRTGGYPATLESPGGRDVHSVAFSPDGSILAVGGSHIVFWDVAAHQAIATLLGSSWRGYRSLAFSPDGAALAAFEGYRTIELWDMTQGPSTATLTSSLDGGSMAFSPDGAILAIGMEDLAQLRDVAAGQEIATVRHGTPVSALAFSSDGSTLATGSWDGWWVKLWDVDTRREIASLSTPGGANSVAFAPGGRAFAAGLQDGNVALWDTKVPEEGPRHLKGHTRAVNSVAFSPDGTTLAAGSGDGTVLLWDLIPRPQALTVVSGDGQRGEPGALLLDSLVVEVRDESGNPLGGVNVTFTVTAGGGTLTTETTTTDPAGLAATTLTLGSRPGPNTVEVSVGGLDPMLFTATAEATPDFDDDGEVGFADFFLFAEAFGGSDPRFDLDGSGSVDFADFFLFAEHFGQPARARLIALARERIGLPERSGLQQNAPNPFNSQTVISWLQLEPGLARLEVYALTGQRVAVLHEGPKRAGLHRLRWDGRGDQGRALASGIYVYRLVTAESAQTRKLTLLR